MRIYKKTLLNSLAGLILVLAVVAPGFAASEGKVLSTPIMPLGEIQPGMKGHILTVMQGAEPEKIELEIIGVMRKANSGGDLILGRLLGDKAEHTGIAAGMSGSPAFINGKMIGALAYAWSFSKDPICGITPIEDMLSTMKEKAPAPGEASSASGAASVDSQVKYRNVMSAYSDFTSGRSQEQPAVQSPAAALGVEVSLPGIGAGRMTPVAVPIIASGFTPASLAAFKPQLEKLFAAPVLISSAASGSAPPDPAVDNLRPGSVFTVILMTGDFEMAGLGTLTWREGDDLLAFGHPMFNIGPIEAPIGGGWIYHVLASNMISNKMGDPGRPLGKLLLDRPFAIRGVMGGEAVMAPVTVSVTDKGSGRRETFHVNVLRDRRYAMQLVSRAAAGSIQRVSGEDGEALLRVRFKGKFRGLDNPVEINDLQYTASVAAAQPVEPVTWLTTNSFRDLDLESCEIEVEIDREINFEVIGQITVAEDRIVPGDTITANIDLRHYNGPVESMPVKVTIPKSASPGLYKLFVTAGMGLILRDTPPDNFDQFVEDILTRAPNNSLIVATIYPEKSPAIRGLTLTDPPMSMVGTVLASGAVGITPVDRLDKMLIPTRDFVAGQGVVTFIVEPESR